ncbi:hypothetical protein FE783_24725 [Paenibacillus mesophilus]|uniref:hypothetical protein n=1 Tax=Paenibacillus mesophilus TaxID=2582849 RepID=UPI00110DB292|nr:hypothetical protein [Paenibacillus mesophilus]TMV46847.1 hypothetical protein FE783_24725 [Paenibacillus mesophilus]
MSKKKPAMAKGGAGRRQSPGRTGRRASAPYLNQPNIRGLLSPGPAAPGTESRGFLPFLDQMGGIDGIISTMGKIQKMMKMFQQFGPILNMLNSFGSMLGPKAATTSLPLKREPQRAFVRKTPPIRKPGVTSRSNKKIPRK